jgi:hypothetical protein
MKITLDDPMLTAYALDELDAAERNEVENALQNSQEHRREIDEIKLTAGLLSTHLAAEPLPRIDWTRPPPVEGKMAEEGKGRKRRIAILALAASVLIGLCLGIVYLLESGPGTPAFAQTAEQIAQAKSITWEITFYTHQSSKDGKTWLVMETRQLAYKAPGLYRETSLDGNGQIRYVEITDAINQRELQLDPDAKTATLSETAVQMRDPDGPWASFLKELKANDLQWVETRSTPAGDVNIFRRSMWDAANGHAWSYDFWIDPKTKHLTELAVPGADIYDPAKDPTRDNKPGKMWKGTVIGGGYVEHDIVYDAKLDDSLFSLEPPAGYSLIKKDRPKVTEREMIDYFAIVADFNGKIFPDQVFPFIFSSDRVNRVWDKPKKDRTPAEQKLLDTDNQYEMAGLNLLPIGQFVQDNTVEGSFRYLGKDVKLGDKNRIVCWYRTKGADAYRVVYGDLSVKDVLPEALPLPDQP